MYRIAIIEDSEEQRSLLASMVRMSDAASSLNIVNVPALQPQSAPALTPDHEYLTADILLLDINLNGDAFTGIDLAERVLAENPEAQIIYVSGYSAYISDAYRTNHTWFLLKPVQQEDLDRALRCAVENLKARASSAMIIKADGRLHKIVPQEILYVESNLRKVHIVRRSGSIEMYGKMADIERELPPSFVRCHKSFLVNMAHIVELSANSITLLGGAVIPVSQRCRKQLREQFLRYVGRVL